MGINTQTYTGDSSNKIICKDQDDARLQSSLTLFCDLSNAHPGIIMNTRSGIKGDPAIFFKQ